MAYKKRNFAELRESAEILIKILDMAQQSMDINELKHLDVQFLIVKHNMILNFNDLENESFFKEVTQ
jgi:hypothetical protein